MLPLLYEPSLKFIFDNINNIKVIFECTNKQTTEYVLFMPCAIILASLKIHFRGITLSTLVGLLFRFLRNLFVVYFVQVLSFLFPYILSDDSNILLALVLLPFQQNEYDGLIYKIDSSHFGCTGVKYEASFNGSLYFNR